MCFNLTNYGILCDCGFGSKMRIEFTLLKGNWILALILSINMHEQTMKEMMMDRKL